MDVPIYLSDIGDNYLINDLEDESKVRILRKSVNLTCLDFSNFEACLEDEDDENWYSINDIFISSYHFWREENLYVLGSSGVYELDFQNKTVHLINN